MTKNDWSVVFWSFVLGFIALAVFCLGTAAHDYGQWEQTDPVVSSWFQSLMQPDNPDIPCCSFADAYYADIVETQDNQLIAVITDDRPDQLLGRPHVPVGTRIAVPTKKIKWDRGNPTGHIVIFLGPELHVFCYVQTGGV